MVRVVRRPAATPATSLRPRVAAAPWFEGDQPRCAVRFFLTKSPGAILNSRRLARRVKGMDALSHPNRHTVSFTTGGLLTASEPKSTLSNSLEYAALVKYAG